MQGYVCIHTHELKQMNKQTVMAQRNDKELTMRNVSATHVIKQCMQGQPIADLSRAIAMTFSDQYRCVLSSIETQRPRCSQPRFI